MIYEVGLAVGISKPILILCHKRHLKEKDIPFDFQSYPLLPYDTYDAEDLTLRLTAKVQEMMDVTRPTVGDPESDGDA